MAERYGTMLKRRKIEDSNQTQGIYAIEYRDIMMAHHSAFTNLAFGVLPPKRIASTIAFY